MAIGTSKITGLLEGEDVMATAAALRQLGVEIKKKGEAWQVTGVGTGGLQQPKATLDMQNSGTGCRLLMGLVATHDINTAFTGDASLRNRPMERVTDPLTQMGAKFIYRRQGRLPLTVEGTADAMPIVYEMPVASAQVKSAILLAALNAPGTTTVIEKSPTRDHTELMLESFGAQIKRVKNKITIKGQPELKPQEITVPGDPSSAAFLIVAALIVPGSHIIIENICVNPLRSGLFETLKKMGADIKFKNQRGQGGEKVADLEVRYSQLKGVKIPAARVPSMIDEYPILAVAAAFAQGKTVMEGLSELRVKESDRLKTIHAGLVANGVKAKMGKDYLIVEGGDVPGGGKVATHFDHRIAMAFLIMGLAAEKPVMIDDSSAISTSFPNFTKLAQSLGGEISGGRKSLVIAIDGPAASGKGTLSRRLAAKLGMQFLDTGLIYRAVGLHLIYDNKDPENKTHAIAAAKKVTANDLANPRLRQEEVGNAASIVSAYPEVREILLDFQRSFARNPAGAVLDGRDIGTVVCPAADLKIFMTASLETRARRRYRELNGQGIEVSYESVLQDLRERDERDSKRKIAPLVPAKDAHVIDTTNLSAEEVFAKVGDLINKLK